MQDVVQLMEIKRLNASMATMRSQLNKYEEQVEECRRYQKFLESVTPIEWQEEQKQALVARQQQRHAAWLLQCEAFKKQKQDAKGETAVTGATNLLGCGFKALEVDAGHKVRHLSSDVHICGCCCIAQPC